MEYIVEFSLALYIDADSAEEADERAWEYVNTGVLDIMDCSTYVKESTET